LEYHDSISVLAKLLLLLPPLLQISADLLQLVYSNRESFLIN